MYYSTSNYCLIAISVISIILGTENIMYGVCLGCILALLLNLWSQACLHIGMTIVSELKKIADKSRFY